MTASLERHRPIVTIDSTLKVLEYDVVDDAALFRLVASQLIEPTSMRVLGEFLPPFDPVDLYPRLF